MDSLYRPRRWPSSRAVVMLGLEVIVLALAVWRLSDAFVSRSNSPKLSPRDELTAHDVLPTPTLDRSIPPRMIVFPGASMSAPIVPADPMRPGRPAPSGGASGHLRDKLA